MLDVETERLILKADSSFCTVGESASVKLASPAPGAYALITMEGSEVYDHRVVKLADGLMTLELPLAPRHVPNVIVRATVGKDGKLLRGVEVITVTQILKELPK